MSRTSLFAFTLLAAAGIPLPGHAQSSPGVRVKWAIEGGAAAGQELTFFSVQGVAMSRVEIGTQAVLITNGDKRIMLMPEQKTWLDLAELESMGARMGMPPGAGRSDSDDVPDMQETGETGSFAGTDCTYYRFTQDETVTELCAAKGLGWAMGPGTGGGMMGARGGMRGAAAAGGRGGMGGMSEMSAEKLRKLRAQFAGGFFPLEIRQTRGGQSVMRMYATELEKRDLSSDLFATDGPEGYTKMSMFGRGRG